MSCQALLTPQGALEVGLGELEEVGSVVSRLPEVDRVLGEGREEVWVGVLADIRTVGGLALDRVEVVVEEMEGVLEDEVDAESVVVDDLL